MRRRKGHPKHEPMLAALRKLFDAHAEMGACGLSTRRTCITGGCEPDAGAVDDGQR